MQPNEIHSQSTGGGILPTIHSNGTSAQALLDQARGVLDALRALRGAMADVAPNGRDYYPQGEEAARTACREHERRRQSVERIWLEYEALAEHCAAAVCRQNDKRVRTRRNQAPTQEVAQ